MTEEQFTKSIMLATEEGYKAGLDEAIEVVKEAERSKRPGGGRITLSDIFVKLQNLKKAKC